MVRPESSERLTLEQEREIDRLCLAFEERVRGGELPEIESFLPAESQALWPRLRQELGLLRDELTARDTETVARALEPGARIAGYELLGRLGEGGMGTVFEAVQDRTRRHVALKVMRAGLDSRAARRFEREARLLGALHHPGIAQLYDAGVHGDGATALPYLVMELLPGRTLVQHAVHAQLERRQRIELLRRVCAAVQHAHEQGIVHRDLKPANIVVDDWDAGDAVGTPKVLDFGVASAIGQPWLQTAETSAAQLVGTISHMSPEQLDEAGTADARSDVYSLGVVLYELVGGQLPHDLRGDSLPAAIDRVRREDPVPLGELDASLAGDLEVIAAKALEKRPAARYPTVAAFAGDLDRFLAHRPIEARPPTAAARAVKFARRHRAIVVGTAVALAALLFALAVVTKFALDQVELREEADQRRRIAEAVSAYLDDLLSRATLDSPDNTRSTTVYDALVAAEAEIDSAFPGDPLSRAAVRRSIGRGFLSQGEPERAGAQFEAAEAELRAALDLRDPDLARVANDVAHALERRGDYAGAEAKYRESLALREAIDRGEDSERAITLANLGSLLERRGDLNQSIELLERSVAMHERLEGPESERLATSLNSLGSVFESAGRVVDAEAAYRRALAIREAVLPHGHLRTQNVMNNLANLLIRSNQLEESEALHRKLLAVREATLDPGHPDLATSYSSLGAIHYQRGEYDEAIRLSRLSAEALELRLGAEHPDTLSQRVNLATVVGASGDAQGQYEILTAVRDPYREVHGEQSVAGLWFREKLARAELALGNLDRAEELAAAVVASYVEAMPGHFRRGTSNGVLTDVAAARGDTASAVAHARETTAIFVETLGADDPFVVRARVKLGRALIDHGATDEALDLVRTSLAELDRIEGDHGKLRADLLALKDELGHGPSNPVTAAAGAGGGS